MKTIAMILAVAAGASAFALSASAENATIQPGIHKGNAKAQTSQTQTPVLSGFLPSDPAKQPAWVKYGSMRK